MLTRLESRVLAVIEQFIGQNGYAPTIAEIAQALGVKSRGTVHRYVLSLISKGSLLREGKGWRGLRLADANPENNSFATEKKYRSDKEMNASNVVADQSLDSFFDPGPGTSPGSASRQTEDDYKGHHSDQLRDQLRDQPRDQLRIPLLGTIAAGVPIEAIPDEQHLDLAVFLIGPDRYALRVTGESMIDAGILDGDTVILRKSSTARTGDIVVALIDNQEATLKRLGKNEDGMIELIPENTAMPLMLYSEKRISIQGVLIGQLRSY